MEDTQRGRPSETQKGACRRGSEGHGEVENKRGCAPFSSSFLHRACEDRGVVCGLGLTCVFLLNSLKTPHLSSTGISNGTITQGSVRTWA